MLNMPRCNICLGHPTLSFAHICSHSHRHNIDKLPFDFWKMTDKEIYDCLHNNEDKRKKRSI